MDKVIVPFGNKEYEFERFKHNLTLLEQYRSVTEFNINGGGFSHDIKPRPHTEPFVRLNIYKGMSIANFEPWAEGKLLMVNLRVLIRKSQTPAFQKSELIRFNFINGIDIDLNLLKNLVLQNLADKQLKSQILKQIADIVDKYPHAKLDELLGSITLPKSTLVSIFNFLGRF